MCWLCVTVIQRPRLISDFCRLIELLGLWDKLVRAVDLNLRCDLCACFKCVGLSPDVVFHMTTPPKPVPFRLIILLFTLALSACAGNVSHGTDGSDKTHTRSGIEVYGDVDVGVGSQRTR